MKKIFRIMVLALTADIILSLPMGAAVAGAARVDKLRVTYVKLPLNVPTIIVKHFGLLEEEFKKDNIGVEWLEITEGGKQIQALAAESIDIASVISSTSAITARANGLDLKITSAFSRAPRAFNIMAIDPTIKKVIDLKGKKVAGPKGSLLNQMLFAALIQSGQKPEDIGYVHMPVPKALAALVSGSVDGALVAGPAVSQGRKPGRPHYRQWRGSGQRSDCHSRERILSTATSGFVETLHSGST